MENVGFSSNGTFYSPLIIYLFFFDYFISLIGKKIFSLRNCLIWHIFIELIKKVKILAHVESVISFNVDTPFVPPISCVSMIIY